MHISCAPHASADPDGKATADVNIPVETPTGGDYFVNVHASPDNMGTIVACGNLAPPSSPK